MFGTKAKRAINKITTDARRKAGKQVPNITSVREKTEVKTDLPKKGTSYCEMNQLLDVVAIAGVVAANPALATSVTPATGSVLNTNGLFRSYR